MVVACLGAIQVDHPEHMSLTACDFCGFCDLGGRARAGLADGWAMAVCERSTEQTLSLLLPYKEAITAEDTAKATELAKSIRRSGMKLPPDENVLLSDWYVDGYLNVSISPLHVRTLAAQPATFVVGTAYPETAS